MHEEAGNSVLKTSGWSVPDTTKRPCDTSLNTAELLIWDMDYRASRWSRWLGITRSYESTGVLRTNLEFFWYIRAELRSQKITLMGKIGSFISRILFGSNSIGANPNATYLIGASGNSFRVAERKEPLLGLWPFLKKMLQATKDLIT
jgi:hypothetical protein